MPIVWASDDREEALNAYVNAYISEEIRAEALARDLGAFLRFLPIASLFHGQTINISEVAREAGVARTTIEGYFSVLEDTLLSWRLPAFEAKPRVRERAHPKVYWIDAGILRALKGNLSPVNLEERGHMLEGLVANFLRSTISYQNIPAELFHFPRYGSYSEVDFIIRKDERLVAVEVMASPNVDSRALKGLRSVQELPGITKRILVSGVMLPERTVDGIDILPFRSFFQIAESGELFLN